jgi:hypothetical protein
MDQANLLPPPNTHPRLGPMWRLAGRAWHVGLVFCGTPSRFVKLDDWTSATMKGDPLPMKAERKKGSPVFVDPCAFDGEKPGLWPLTEMSEAEVKEFMHAQGQYQQHVTPL